LREKGIVTNTVVATSLADVARGNRFPLFRVDALQQRVAIAPDQLVGQNVDPSLTIPGDPVLPGRSPRWEACLHGV
jgi:hypothetical protein